MAGDGRRDSRRIRCGADLVRDVAKGHGRGASERARRHGKNSSIAHHGDRGKAQGRVVRLAAGLGSASGSTSKCPSGRRLALNWPQEKGIRRPSKDSTWASHAREHGRLGAQAVVQWGQTARCAACGLWRPMGPCRTSSLTTSGQCRPHRRAVNVTLAHPRLHQAALGSARATQDVRQCVWHGRRAASGLGVAPRAVAFEGGRNWRARGGTLSDVVSHDAVRGTHVLCSGRCGCEGAFVRGPL